MEYKGVADPVGRSLAYAQQSLYARGHLNLERTCCRRIGRSNEGLVSMKFPEFERFVRNIRQADAYGGRASFETVDVT